MLPRVTSVIGVCVCVCACECACVRVVGSGDTDRPSNPIEVGECAEQNRKAKESQESPDPFFIENVI